jgi:23S rRNA pseudouridine1911/1915/1917 synthase
MNPLLHILHDDDDLLAVKKPAGLVCHPTKGDVYSSLISRVRLHLGEASDPRLVNRLDRETSGIVVIAKTAAVDAGLKKRFTQRAVQKEYAAIVHGHPVPDAGTCDQPLGPDANSPVAIMDTVRADGKKAVTHWRVLQRFVRAEGNFSLLEVVPESGRKHQIRIHLAHLGHPVVGDKIYGGDPLHYLSFINHQLTRGQRIRLLTPCHALHAARLQFEWRNTQFDFRAEPEPWFNDFAASRPCPPDWEERYL